jgi:gamma-glutamylcyclotransferase (GGCT)/AIG2-like uncharacterized protein YtfP
MPSMTPDADSLRAECYEWTTEATKHLKLLRDYAATPGNAWLAKGELSKISTIVGELDRMLEEIKQADAR